MTKRQFGQHFLIAPFYAKRIAEAVPASADANVLEIGAGKGAVSAYLVQKFKNLHLVEIDYDMVQLLEQRLEKGHWILHRCDILDFDYAQAGFPIHVVGNLPYNIAALIIRKTLLYGSVIESFTFMVQREVAERIVAPVGTKRNGYLSIFCQFFGKPKILFHVPPGAFFPKPKVESSVVQIVVDKSLDFIIPKNEWTAFFDFVSNGFSMRRKMLVNSLGAKGDKEFYYNILKNIGVDLKARPEDLSISQWLVLFKKSCER